MKLFLPVPFLSFFTWNVNVLCRVRLQQSHGESWERKTVSQSQWRKCRYTGVLASRSLSTSEKLTNKLDAVSQLPPWKPCWVLEAIQVSAVDHVFLNSPQTKTEKGESPLSLSLSDRRSVFLDGFFVSRFGYRSIKKFSNPYFYGKR